MSATSQLASMPIDIVGSSSFGRSPKISAASTFNMFISDGALVSFFGYKKKVPINFSGIEGRGIYKSTKYDHLIAVIDNGLYTIDRNFGVSQVGALDTSTGKVFITENDGNQIAVADGEKIYIFNYLLTSFDVVTVDFTPGYITFQDGYFIATDSATNQWRLSDPNNGLIWPNDAPNVGLLQSKADRCIAAVTLGRQLFIFGRTVCEPWFDQGLQLFPYARTNQYLIDYGCVSSSTIATGFNIMCWLGINEKSGLAIMVSDGGQPKEISTDGVNYELNRLNNPEDSYAFIVKKDGHIFYIITFVEDNKTYMYDFNTNLFFQLSDQNQDYFISRQVAFFNNTYYFVSFEDGYLYELSDEHTKYDEHIIPRIRVCTNYKRPDASWFIINNINVVMEQGLAKESGRIDLAISRDGGYNFGNFAGRELNPLGTKKNKIDFYSLGSANDCVVQFRIWTDGRIVINGATMSTYQ